MTIVDNRKRIAPLLAYACRKGKEYENFRIRKFNDPKTSDIGRLPNSGFARTDVPVAEHCTINSFKKLETQV